VSESRPPTPSQTVGPFFGFALPFPGDAEAVEPSEPDAVRIEGQLLDGEGAAVTDGLLEIWQGDQFARCRTDTEGAYHFVLRRPRALSGPEGRAQAPHFNLTVFARGLLRHLATRVYLPGADAGDAVLERIDPQRRSTLVARDERGVLHFDAHLGGPDETVFFEL
jgi:protocatechuate 3,4-dioxygenase alpha subunit